LKLKRAQVHINSLEGRARRFRTLYPDPNAGYETHSDPDAHAFYVQGSRPIPDDWGPAVGDILTNLRAALDHLTWVLAWQNLGEELYRLPDGEQRRIAFPFTDSESAFEGTTTYRHIIPGARNPMESLQPYHAADWPGLYVLTLLNDFTNMDKHRVVTPVLRQGAIRLGPDSGARIALDFHEQDYTLIFTAKTAARISDQFDPSYSVDIVFEESPIAAGDFPSDMPGLLHPGLPIGVFAFIHEFIRDEVFPLFDGFLSEPPRVE